MRNYSDNVNTYLFQGCDTACFMQDKACMGVIWNIWSTSNITDAVSGTKFFQTPQPQGEALNPIWADVHIKLSVTNKHTQGYIIVSFTRDEVAATVD